MIILIASFKRRNDAQVIEGYQKSMLVDLQKAGISKDKLPRFHVMDVGTGRQSIVFEKLGASKVSHYDFSHDNVNHLNHYIESHNLSHRIFSQQADLVKYPLPEQQYDLIYLQGIVQHFSHTGNGLRNCIRSLKKGGYLWLYFYRSGTWPMFLKYMIRDLIKESSQASEYFINSTLLNSDEVLPTFQVSSIMDNFFTTNMHLYSPHDYIDFVKRCGLEIISSSRLDPFGKKVDHQFAYQSAVLTLKKVQDLDLSSVDTEILSPQNSINQLSESGYDSQEIIETITLYQKVKSTLADKQASPSTIQAFSFFLNRHLQLAANHYKRAACYSPEAHAQLQTAFKNFLSLLPTI